jgi:hypothetical protein
MNEKRKGKGECRASLGLTMKQSLGENCCSGKKSDLRYGNQVRNLNYTGWVHIIGLEI